LTVAASPCLRRATRAAWCLTLAATLLLWGCAPAPPTTPPAERSATGKLDSPPAPASAPTATASSLTAPKPKELFKLRLGLSTTPAPALPNSVLWLAKDLGYYEREGLDVELVEVQGTPSVITAMRTGDVDVGNIGTEEVVKLTANKTLELRAIHAPDASLYFLIAARDSLASVSDLKGKAFGIARLGSVDHSMTELVFRAKGLDPDDLDWVAIGAPGVRAQALTADRIAATTMSVATWATIQHESGVRILVNAEDYFAAAPIVQKVDAVTTKTLMEKPEQLRRFTTAIIKASREFADNKQMWVNAIAKRRPDLDHNDLAQLWDQFRRSWAVNGLMNLNRYQETAEFLYATADFNDVPRIHVRDWADTQFTDTVLREIGVFEKFDEPGRTIQ
jgi:NitT/TauT family transport system substrate-binding protein